MSWGSGYLLMRDVIKGLQQKGVPDQIRLDVYSVMVPAMQARDWDTEVDAMGDDPIYDRYIMTEFAEWFGDDD